MIKESNIVSWDDLEHVLHINNKNHHVNSNDKAGYRHNVESSANNALYLFAAVLV